MILTSFATFAAKWPVAMARDELDIKALIQEYREKLYRAKSAKRAKKGEGPDSIPGVKIQIKSGLFFGN